MRTQGHHRREGGAARPAGDQLRRQGSRTFGKCFAFDLDCDGATESVAALASGSAYLAFDRNDDGRINDGSELFGTKSGNGFADLAAFDDDGNRWLDENDAVFDRLRIWEPADAGEARQSTLRERGVGALISSRWPRLSR